MCVAAMRLCVLVGGGGMQSREQKRAAVAAQLCGDRWLRFADADHVTWVVSGDVCVASWAQWWCCACACCVHVSNVHMHMLSSCSFAESAVLVLYLCCVMCCACAVLVLCLCCVSCVVSHVLCHMCCAVVCRWADPVATDDPIMQKLRPLLAGEHKYGGCWVLCFGG